MVCSDVVWENEMNWCLSETPLIIVWFEAHVRVHVSVD